METTEEVNSAPTEEADVLPAEGEATEVAGEAEASDGEAVEPNSEADDNAFLADLFAPREEASATIAALDDLMEAQGNRSWRGVSIENTLAMIENVEARDAVAKLLHNARNLGLRSSDQAARQLREIDAQRDELKRATERFHEERAQMWAMFTDPTLREAAKPPEGQEPEFALNPQAWVEWHRQKDKADILADVLGRIGKVSEEHQAKANEILAARQREEAKENLRAWIEAEAPDFHEHGDDIYSVMQASSLNAQDAYLLVKAKKGEPTTPKDPAKTARQRMRKAGRTQRAELPENVDTETLMRWAAENDGAAEEYVKAAGSLSLL